MMFRDTIELISSTIDYNNPFPESSENSRIVFANKRSPTRAEYAANDGRGINATFVFDVREGEYGGEQALRYKGEKYNVYRTFERGFYTEIYVGSAKAEATP